MLGGRSPLEVARLPDSALTAWLVQPPREVRRRQGDHHRDTNQEEFQAGGDGQADRRAERDHRQGRDGPAPCAHNTLRRYSRTGS